MYRCYRVFSFSADIVCTTLSRRKPPQRRSAKTTTWCIENHYLEFLHE